MNKDKTEILEDEMRPEYDLSQLKGRVRGKYVERYRAGTNLVLLESDVQAVFPDAEAVKGSVANVDESCASASAKASLIVFQLISNEH